MAAFLDLIIKSDFMAAGLKMNQPFATRLAMVLISILALGYIAILGEKLLAPLIFSFLCALLLLPLADFMEVKLKIPRAGAAVICLFFFMLMLALVMYTIGTQISNLAGDWPQFKEQFHHSLDDLQKWIASRFHLDIQQQKNYISNTTSKVFSSGSSVVGTTILSVSSVLFFVALINVYTFFLLLYRRLIFKFLTSVFPKKNTPLVRDVVENIRSIIRRYIVGLLLEMLIVAALCTTSFIISGIRYGLLFGLITALFNIIPYAGIFTSLLLTSFITFAVSGASAKLIVVIITIVAVHLIDSNILLPFIVGSKIRINGMITVMAVIVGEMVWGIDGMFLAVPMVAMVKIIFDRIDSLRPWGMLLGHEDDKVEPISDSDLTTRERRESNSQLP